MPNALVITDKPDRPETLPDRGRDQLKAEALNALEGPLLAKMSGGWVWPIIDIEVETTLFRIDVCGLSEVKRFSEIIALIDGNGQEHDSDQFWHD